MTVNPERIIGGEVADPTVNVEEEAIARYEAQVLHQKLDRLPERHRRVLVWSFGLNGVDELTLKEIGARLGCSESFASRLRTRALARLRSLYRETSASTNGSAHSRANGKGRG
jgi:RNA polymerase sigma factor (sigma-70 family)